jgi:hypothetical protein
MAEPMAIVNNVTRLLDSRKVRYSAFETPPEKLGALERAFSECAGRDRFKTIVVTRPAPKPFRRPYPATAMDLKLLAVVVGEKKVILPMSAKPRSDRSSGRRNITLHSSNVVSRWSSTTLPSHTPKPRIRRAARLNIRIQWCTGGLTNAGLLPSAAGRMSRSQLAQNARGQVPNWFL